MAVIGVQVTPFCAGKREEFYVHPKLGGHLFTQMTDTIALKARIVSAIYFSRCLNLFAPVNRYRGDDTSDNLT